MCVCRGDKAQGVHALSLSHPITACLYALSSSLTPSMHGTVICPSLTPSLHATMLSPSQCGSISPGSAHCMLADEIASCWDERAHLQVYCVLGWDESAHCMLADELASCWDEYVHLCVDCFLGWDESAHCMLADELASCWDECAHL
jgi:hypothetical protein